MHDITLSSSNPSLSLLLAEIAAIYSIAVQRVTHNRALIISRKVLSHGLTSLLLVITIVSALSLVHMAIAATAPATRADHGVATAGVRSMPPSPTHQLKATVAPKSLQASIPTHIYIPAAHVDATIDSVGLNDNGSLQVPYRDDTGWYKDSPTPGQIGPAIIDGHVDSVYGLAVFWYLRDLKPGDSISIDRADGGTVHFSVEQVASYDQHNFPTQKVYGNIDYAGLRLITCDGTFDYTTRHYSNNLVVYARANL